MTRTSAMIRLALAAVAVALLAGPAAASDPFADLTEKTNQKIVKLFGFGGFRGINSYGTGILISPDGLILTAATQMLDATDVITIHLYDGRRMKAVTLATEPELDVALLKIKVDGKKIDEPTGLDLPYFDLAEAAKRPPAQPGDWVLAFTNCFEIAMRDEPISVQRGVVSAYSKLAGRRGIFDFPYTGEVYVVDAITNNPGAAGAALTDRKGNLLGLVGREIKNRLSETWMNYAIPVGAKVEVKQGDKSVTVSIPEFVELAKQGKYKKIEKPKDAAGPGGFHGIVFVPNILERTPPYVEDLMPGSPAAKAEPADPEDKPGLRPDDLVSFVDGEPVYSIKSFQEYLRKTRPGDKVRLEVRRGDKLITYDVTLGEHPKGSAPPTPPPATGPGKP